MEGILVVDKPSGPTSHDIVNILRRATGLKRIGHTGTLDPMATGVMVLLIGTATRIARFLELEPKTYVAEAAFGIVTDTQDITGSLLRESSEMPSIASVRAMMPEFTGEIAQVPPMVSAVKVGGTPLYKAARKGHVVERAERRVHIYKFELLDSYEFEGRLRASFEVVCSAGTYVRTLIHDLGEKLGTGATLSSLRRTKVGRFGLDGAVTLDEIKEGPSVIARRIISMDEALEHLGEAFVGDEAAARVKNGRGANINELETSPPSPGAHGFVRIKTRDGELLALGRLDEDNGVTIAPKVVFVTHE